MATVKQYLFEDRNFDPDYDPEDENSFEFAGEREEAEAEAEAEEMEEELPPTFSEEEVLDIQQKAFEEGKVAGLTEASEHFENMVANAMTLIAQNLPGLFDARAQAEQQHETQSLDISRTVVRKIIPAYAEAHGVDEIVNVVARCLEPLRAEPRIIIKVHESLRDTTHEKLTKVAEEVGFDGRVVVMAHEEIEAGDCKIEWSDGGAERNSEALWLQIDEIIERNLTQGVEEGDTQEEAQNQDTSPAPADGPQGG